MIIFLFLLSILFVGSVLADPGDIDTTGFGAPNGYVTESLGTAGTNANAVAIQSDGKILVRGSANNDSNTDMAIIRLDTDGSLDTDFGGDEKVTLAIGTQNDEVWDLAVQENGKILAVGFVFT